MDLFGLLFPKFCLGCGKFGSYLCESCISQVGLYKSPFCSECGRASIYGLTHQGCLKRDSLHGLICLFEYKDPLKKLIHRLKYRFNTDLIATLDLLLAKTSFPVVLREYSLIPLPLHQLRENWRGFNQAALLGEKIAARYELELSKDLLSRGSFEKSQVRLSLQERKANLKGAFSIESDVKGKNLIVFDDIWTSGATMREAVSTLKQAGANKVWGLCLATSHRIH
jgi:competence protein ComFC